MVKILVLPGNIALVRPPLAKLAPLQRYRPFVFEDGGFVGGLEEEELAVAAGLSPCSALPAGLVPRFQEELSAAGYSVIVEDRRSFDESFHINRKLCQISWGAEESLLRAVRAHPQGQLSFQRYDGLPWRLGHLCNLWPKARILIVTDTHTGAHSICSEDLPRYLGASVGLLTQDPWNMDARCVVTTQRWLLRLRLRAWQVLLLLVHGSSDVSRATYRAVVRGRAPRVYALTYHNARLGLRTQLRLEAMAGPVIDPLEQP
jgi:hypothetical protein